MAAIHAPCCSIFWNTPWPAVPFADEGFDKIATPKMIDRVGDSRYRSQHLLPFRKAKVTACSLGTPAFIHAIGVKRRQPPSPRHRLVIHPYQIHFGLFGLPSAPAVCA